MPRLSLWSPNKQNDYRFLDRSIREMFTVGGIDMYIHKYMGPELKEGDTPSEDDILKIEDLLFLENRNRNYEDDIRVIRGVYRVQDLDFDLSQFGLFVAGDNLFIQFHYNDMIDYFGRKLMNGDVIEIPNLKDYDPLSNVASIPKFYVVQEGAFASEGFSATWYPHLWRVKCVPMKGSQEFKDILDKCLEPTHPSIDGDQETDDDCCSLGDLLCQHNKNIAINDGVVWEANDYVPLSGYDNEKFFILGDGQDHTESPVRADNNIITVDSDLLTADSGIPQIISDGFALGYLTGNGMPPNGRPVTRAVKFPPGPGEGDYVLRMDYVPNRLFKYDGTMWVMIEDNVRTDMYLGHTVKTQRSGFVNNDEMIQTTDRGEIPSRQSLSKLLEPKEDN